MFLRTRYRILNTIVRHQLQLRDVFIWILISVMSSHNADIGWQLNKSFEQLLFLKWNSAVWPVDTAVELLLYGCGLWTIPIVICCWRLINDAVRLAMSNCFLTHNWILVASLLLPFAINGNVTPYKELIIWIYGTSSCIVICKSYELLKRSVFGPPCIFPSTRHTERSPQQLAQTLATDMVSHRSD